MVKIHFTTVGPRLRNDDVRRAEALLGVTLPQDYVRFLFDTNGGWAGDSAGRYCFPVYGLKGSDTSSIHVMHSALRTDDDSGIFEETQSIMDRLPDGVIVTGCDLAGGLIVLGTRGEYRNRVMLRVTDEEVPRRSAFRPV